MFEVFGKEKVNLGRQKELDIAKGLAVIFMVLVHVYEVYGEEVEGTMFSKVIEFLGSPPAAPVFMFLLGTGLVYSRKSTPKLVFTRGCKLLVLAYVLNFFRDFIPYMIIGKVENDPSSVAEAWDSLFGIDILAFAGLAFIFFAFVKKHDLKDRALIALWGMFSSLGLLLSSITVENEVFNAVFGLIWGTNENSWFPFSSWIFYPILGYMFAERLTRCKDKDKLYKELFILTTPMVSALWICAYVKKIDFGIFDLFQTNYYHHDIIGNIIMGIFVIQWISFIYLITRKLSDNVYKHFVRWSKNCNGIYCVHWILLGYSMLILEDAYGAVMLCVLAVILFILSDIISEILAKKKIRI